MVKRVGQFIDEIEKNNVRLSLVMFMSSDPEEVKPKYTLVLSSPDFDKKDPKTAYELIANILLKDFFDVKSEFISTIMIIRSTDSFVKSINMVMDVDKYAIVNINSSQLYQAYVKNGIVFLSKKNIRQMILENKKLDSIDAQTVLMHATKTLIG